MIICPQCSKNIYRASAISRLARFLSAASPEREAALQDAPRTIHEAVFFAENDHSLSKGEQHD